MAASDSPQTLIARGETLAAGGDLAGAIAAFSAALALHPKDSAAWRGLGKAQLDLGDHDRARASFAQALAIVPYDRYAAHMLSALSGQADQRTSGYVADLFDSYADGFDTHLTDTLNYRIPQSIQTLLTPRGPFDSLLDLGCGTGLVGVALDNIVGSMDGIDIAPKMTRKAHERGLYRYLRTGDILAALASDPELRGPYDLVTAADVFVYIGALDAMFAAIAGILAPGGLFAFSVEDVDGTAVALRSSGRFAHPRPYIAQLAATHGLDLLTEQDHPIRMERDQPIAGTLYLLSKSGCRLLATP